VAGDDQYDLQDDVTPAMFSIRKFVKRFKYSPGRKSLLQQKMAKSEKMELHVILDCKTRWNTLERMIKRFLKILNPIKIVFCHLWKEECHEILRDMLNCLKPVRLVRVVEALSNRDVNLLISEGIFSSLKK
jgi:adenylate kinase family enzyme